MKLTESPVIANVKAEIFGHDVEVHIVEYDRELDCLGRIYYYENVVYAAHIPGKLGETEQILIHELTHLALKLTCNAPINHGLSDDDPAYSAEKVCEMMSLLAPGIIRCAKLIMKTLGPKVADE